MMWAVFRHPTTIQTPSYYIQTPTTTIQTPNYYTDTHIYALQTHNFLSFDVAAVFARGKIQTPNYYIQTL